MEWLASATQTRERPLRVALCDGHGVFRRRLLIALEHDPDVAVVAEADVPGALGSALVDAPADVLVVDLASPDGDPVDGIRRLSSALPDVAILGLAGPGDDAVPALLAGAAGAMTKTAALRRGAGAIREVAAGNVFVDRRAAQFLARRVEDHERLDGLNSHHLELLYQLSAGRSIRELGPFFRSDAIRLQADLRRVIDVLRADAA